MTTIARLTPSLRLRTVTLAALFGFTTFFVQLAPTDVPLPRPAALSPQPVAALGCATEPAFTGFITNTYTTTPATYSTTGLARGYISDVLADWSCTAYYRYDGLAWMRDDAEGDANYHWGTLINSTTVPCNWVVGETTYLKANGAAHCHTSDSDHGMQLQLLNFTGDLQEGVWHADNSPDAPGDYMFIHSDCTTYYEGSGLSGERFRWNVTFATTDVVNRPGDNCDPSVIDGTGTTQSIVVDGTPPVIGFDWPVAGGPALVTSSFAGVKFDATDNVAGFASGANDWDLQRQKATWSGSACGTFANDTAAGSLVSGTTNALDQVSSQGLVDNTCYRWTLAATDANGNAATSITSGSIRTSVTGNLGQQPQHTFETWDLGADDGLAVNVGTGNLVLTHPIVSLPIRGGSFDLGLTYNRHDTTNVGMGPGWRLDAFRRLAIDATTGAVTLTDGDGSRHVFTVASTVGTVTTYNRPPTMYAALVKDTGQAIEFTLTYRDKSSDLFDLFGTTAALLASERDRFGNAVVFTYMAGTTNIDYATDPAGRIVDFTWDTAPTPDRLTSIKDWAVVSAGVVQTSGTPNRTQRFFYDAPANLAGWADPLNTTDSCPTGGNHVTCVAYPTAGLDIAKSQRYATFSAGVLGTGSRVITTKVTFDGLDVATVRDAQEVTNATSGTALTHSAPYQTQVVRRGDGVASSDTTTRYTLVSAADAYARVATEARKLGAAWLTTTTTYDATYPVEVATVTEDAGGTLQRSTTTTYKASSMGLVARIDAPLDGTYRHYTDFTYNANNDVTQQIVSRQGDATLRTTTRNCYSATSCGTADNDLRLFATIDNYVDGTKGGSNGHVEDVTVEYQYDSYGQRTRETRYNYASGGTLLDSRAIGFEYDINGSLTKDIVNYVSGTVTSPGDDITPNATTNARTDLTRVHIYDTAGNRVSMADARRAIETAKGTVLVADDFVSRWTFDSLDQRLTEKTPTTPGVTISQRTSVDTYDELGQIRATTDFAGLNTASEFDRVGRATRTFEDPDGGAGPTLARIASQSTFDPSGRTLTVKDERQLPGGLGQTTNLYDELGRLVSTIEADGVAEASETRIGYDTLDRRATYEPGWAADGSHQTTTYRYDLGDHVLETDDEFACTRQGYDYRGLVTGTREGLVSGAMACTGTGSRWLTSSFDAPGRLTQTVIADSSDPAEIGDKTTIATYDAVGNQRTSGTYDASSGITATKSLTSNLLDQQTKEVGADGSVGQTNYDPTGNPTDRCFWASSTTETCHIAGWGGYADPPDTSSTTAYDARNNRISLLTPGTGETTYDPDADYQIAAVYLPTITGKEHQSLYQYWPERHQLKSITHQLCTVTPPSHTCGSPVPTGSSSYELDANDNRTKVTETATGAAPVTRYYCHDARNQLTGVGDASNCTGSPESFWYDASGNRTQAVAGTTTNFAYNPSGQLCKVGSTTCGTPNVIHDDAGRISSWNGWTLQYDGDSRLLRACHSTACSGSIDKVEFTYDGDGHRTYLREYTAGALTKVTQFRYQGESITQEWTGPTDATIALARTYVVDEAGAIVKVCDPDCAGSNPTYLVTWNGHGDAQGLWRIESTG